MLSSMKTTLANYTFNRDADLIGIGSTAHVFMGSHAEKQGHFALKIAIQPHVTFDTEVNALQTMEGNPGFVQVFEHEPDYYVSTLTGPDVESLMQYFGDKGRKLKRFVVLDAILQLVDRVRALHDKGFVHRDIKPDNMAMGFNSLQLMLLDMGNVVRYRDANGDHIVDTEQDIVVGTERYCSVRCHQKRTPSRGDDMVSIAYTAIYMRDGSLPWQGAGLPPNATTIDRMHAKERYAETCDAATRALLTHAASIGFACEPNYDEFIGLVKNAVPIPSDEDPDGSWW